MTEWRQFRLPTWNVISKIMPGRIIVDGRNIWNRTELEELGYSYTRIGENRLQNEKKIKSVRCGFHRGPLGAITTHC